MDRLVRVLASLLIVAVFGEASKGAGLAARPASVKPARTIVRPCERRDAVWVKFRDDLPVRAENGALTDRNCGVLGGAAAPILANPAGGKWRADISIGEVKLEQLRQTAQRNLGKSVADLRTQFILELPAGADPGAAIDALNSLNAVEIALPLPQPVVAPIAPNYQANQGYLNPAPVGIDALGTWVFPYNSAGASVRIADVEYSWNFSHADLPPPQLVGPAPVDPFGDNNHGTAVLGELVSLNDGHGTTGVAHLSGSVYVAAANTASGYNVGAAILNAMNAMSAGDVILIEQQLIGPNYTGNPPGTQVGLIPVEWYLPYYNAIVTAVGNGMVVVEAAGNGSQNLDDPIYSTGNGGHWPFLSANDSGAIIVGAGGAPGGPSGNLSRLSFSNYGSTVDLQGWGEAVFTTGYGGAYSAEGVNRYYTATFSGTSSASPIVAGACALLQDLHKQRNNGAVLSPAAIRSFLRDTGAAQLSGVNPASQNIGPRPIVTAAAAAVLALDHTPPEPNPMYFVQPPAPMSENSVSMIATAANDAQTGPTQYFFAESSGGGHNSGWISSTSYMDWGLSPNTSYWYGVTARDSASPPNETTASFAIETATMIETPQGAAFSNVGDMSMTITAAGFFSNLTAGNSGLFFEVNPPAGGPANMWTTNSSIDVTGLTPGVQYTVRVKARNRLGAETAFSMAVSQATSGGGGSGDTQPPFPNPMGFVGPPSADSASAISMSAMFAFDTQSPPVMYYFQNASGPGHDSGWTGIQSYTDMSLPANTEFSYRVRARDSALPPNETSESMDATASTLIETPMGVYFGPVTSTSVVVNVSGPLSNLQDGASGVYLEMMPPVAGSGAYAWSQNASLRLSGLSPGTTYTIRAKARNRLGVETPFSPSGSMATLSVVRADCDGNGVFESSFDIPCFVDVLVRHNSDPAAAARCDMNGDGVADGMDIQAFMQCAIGGCP